GKTVAYLAARLDGPTPHDIYLQPLAGGAARNLTGASVDRMIAGYVWGADETILCLAINGFRTQFYKVHPDGRAETIGSFAVNPGAFDAAANRVAFVGETAVEAPELWFSERPSQVEKVTNLNENWKQISLIK